MRIVLSHLIEAHDRLVRFPSGVREDVDFSETSLILNTRELPLPPPLHGARAAYHRNGFFYTAGFFVRGAHDLDFSPVFPALVREFGSCYICTDRSSGAGYIKSSADNPSPCIGITAGTLSENDSSKGYALFLGDTGAPPLLLPKNVAEFTEQIAPLETAANTIVRALVGRIPSRFQELTLELHCI